MSSKTRKKINFVLLALVVLVIFTLTNLVFSENGLDEKTKINLTNKANSLDRDEVFVDYSAFKSFKSIHHLEAYKNFKTAIDLKAKYTKFHGSVLVAYRDQIIFQESYGFKNPVNKTSLRSDTSFELASVSKQFTAAAVLMLAEENCLDIDAPVANYLPDFKFESVSIRQLLKHRSGLWDYMYITEAFWNKSYAPNNQEVVKLISAHQRHLNFTPGSRFNYNNSNYVVLAALVEKVSGISFENFLGERILDSLCLNDTYIGLPHRAIDFVANAFIGYGRGYVNLPPSFHNRALGDKGVYASSTDLFRWFIALKNNKVLSKDYVELMFNQDEFDTYKYGMGFRTKYTNTKEPVIYHNGIWDGYRNGLSYFPQDDLVVIVLSNTQNRRKKYMQNKLIKEAKAFINQPNVVQNLSSRKKEKELVL